MRLMLDTFGAFASASRMRNCQGALPLCLLLAHNQSYGICTVSGGAHQWNLSAGLERLVIKQTWLNLITRSLLIEVQCGSFETSVWARPVCPGAERHQQRMLQVWLYLALCSSSRTHSVSAWVLVLTHTLTSSVIIQQCRLFLIQWLLKHVCAAAALPELLWQATWKDTHCLTICMHGTQPLYLLAGRPSQAPFKCSSAMPGMRALLRGASMCAILHGSQSHTPSHPARNATGQEHSCRGG